MSAPFESVTRIEGMMADSFVDEAGLWAASVWLPRPVSTFIGFASGRDDQFTALRDAFVAAGRNLAALRALVVLLVLGCVQAAPAVVTAGGADAR